MAGANWGTAALAAWITLSDTILAPGLDRF